MVNCHERIISTPLREKFGDDRSPTSEFRDNRRVDRAAGRGCSTC